jgi:hypothetical protein
LETDDGQLIFLWVRLTEQEALLELGTDDDQADQDDDDPESPI